MSDISNFDNFSSDHNIINNSTSVNDVDDVIDSGKQHDIYIDTVLEDDVVLFPNQLNNDLYINLKLNLESKIKNKCFKDYGYIYEIFDIVEFNNGEIIPEQNLGCVQFKVKFSCRLCKFYPGMTVIAKVAQNNELLLHLYKNPAFIDVRPPNFNSDVFEIDQATHKIKLIGGDTLDKGDYVKVKISKVKFVNKETHIVCLGYLDDVVSDDEISQYWHDFYNDHLS